MANGEIGYVMFYLVFFSFIAFLGSQGGAGLDGELGGLPVLDSDPGVFSFLGYGFDLVVYFLGLQGLTVLGLSAGVSALVGIVFDGTMLYVIVRLVRGGG